MIKYTEEMKEWLRENVPCGALYKDILVEFKEKFKVDTNLKAFKSSLKRFGIKNGNNGFIKKGSIPWNKGTKGIMKANKTSFKKGNRPSNCLPIGSERIDRGYTLVKVSNKGIQYERWKYKHRIIWEQEYGEVPKGYTLIFLDKNKKKYNFRKFVLGL